MNDLEKIKEINKQNKELHEIQQKKQSFKDALEMIIGVLFLVGIGFVCYHWGYTSGHNDFLQKQQEIVIDKQE